MRQIVLPFLRGLFMAGVAAFMMDTVVFAAPQALSLQECLDQALQKNLTIQMTQSDADQAKETLNAAKSSNGISVQAVNTDYWKRPNSSTDPNSVADTMTLVTNQIAFSLPLYTGGKNENTIKAAFFSYDTAQKNREISREQIKYQTTVAYYKVLQYKNLLQADQATVRDYTLHLNNLQTSYAAGLASKLELLQTKVNLANAQDAEMKDQENYKNAEVILKNIVEIPRDQEIELTENFPYDKDREIELVDCLARAKENRLESKVAQNAVKIAEHQVAAAESGKRPSLALNGFEGWQGNNLADSNNEYFSVYVTLSYNLFDSGLTAAQIKAAKASLSKAQKAASQQDNTIYADVTQYYWGMKEAEKRVDTVKVAVEEAEEAFKIAQVSFSAGMETNQDVLDAEVALNTARNNYIQALYDYNANRAGLDMAMGIVA